MKQYKLTVDESAIILILGSQYNKHPAMSAMMIKDTFKRLLGTEVNVKSIYSVIDLLVQKGLICRERIQKKVGTQLRTKLQFKLTSTGHKVYRTEIKENTTVQHQEVFNEESVGQSYRPVEGILV